MLTSSLLSLIVVLGTQEAKTPSPSASASASAPIPATEAKPAPDGAVIAFETAMGTIQVGLYATMAPRSSRNFLNYAKSGFFNGTVFHRVIPGFMIQGGGMDAKMVEKSPGPPVRNEARNGLLNTRGSVALARTSDPHSATAQFFINLKDNPGLDFGIARDGWGYAVFGEVLSGMEVVDSIALVPRTRVGPHENVPVKPILITRVRVISEPAPPSPPAVTKAGSPTPAKPASAPKAAPRVSPATPAKPKPSASPAGR